MKYTDIHGWFDFEDIYTEMVDKASDGSVFVELGVWMGKSAIFMAETIKNSGKKITFYAVDSWKKEVNFLGSEGVFEKNNGDIFPQFLKNCVDCGVSNYIKPLRMRTELASEFFPPESLDFVFIDAGHDPVPFRMDLDKWLPKIKLGGVCAGHDFYHPPINATLKCALPEHYKYIGKTSGSTWIYYKI